MKKTAKKKKLPAGKPKDIIPAKPFAGDEENGFNYGGLPERDLKKNLGGCG